MKSWKKTGALLLALVMTCCLAACGNNGAGSGTADSGAASSGAATSGAASSGAASSGATGSGDAAKSDLAYVQDKGVLVVGITEYEPMDYQDANGNWIGFDADMAQLFAESIGVEAEFQIITDWDSKVMELEGKTVDVVWNGMTLTDEVLSSMECTNPYFYNAQCVIVPKDKADSYKAIEDMADLQFAAENGSAGQAELENLGYACTPTQDQATALLEVQSGNADAAVIDYLMAKAMTGEGTSYADLTTVLSLNEEQYGVGFRKGSDMAAELNKFFTQSYADGSMQALAENYDIADNLIPQ